MRDRYMLLLLAATLATGLLYRVRRFPGSRIRVDCSWCHIAYNFVEHWLRGSKAIWALRLSGLILNRILIAAVYDVLMLTDNELVYYATGAICPRFVNTCSKAMSKM